MGDISMSMIYAIDAASKCGGVTESSIKSIDAYEVS